MVPGRLSHGHDVLSSYLLHQHSSPSTQRLVFVVHGLNGGTGERYVLDLVAKFVSDGCVVAAINARGIGSAPLRSDVFFHGARCSDLYVAMQSGMDLLHEALRRAADPESAVVVSNGDIHSAENGAVANARSGHDKSGGGNHAASNGINQQPPLLEAQAVGVSIGGMLLAQLLSQMGGTMDAVVPPRMIDFGPSVPLTGAVAVSGWLDTASNLGVNTKSQRLWQPFVVLACKQQLLRHWRGKIEHRNARLEGKQVDVEQIANRLAHNLFVREEERINSEHFSWARLRVRHLERVANILRLKQLDRKALSLKAAFGSSKTRFKPIDVATVVAGPNMKAFDEDFVAPYSGFGTARVYYACERVSGRAMRICPFLHLFAKDDPIVDARDVSKEILGPTLSDAAAEGGRGDRAGQHTSILYLTRSGGHVGWPGDGNGWVFMRDAASTFLTACSKSNLWQEA